MGNVIDQIGATNLVLPGIGEPNIALRAIYRLWCVYEVANTPQGKLKVSIGQFYPVRSALESYAKAINDVSVEAADCVMPEDKKMILGLVEKGL